MKTTVLILSLISAMALSACLSGCSESKAAAPLQYGSIVGATCKIQFRLDALGRAARLNIGDRPEFETIDGAFVNLTAKFVRFNEDWIVLQDGQGEIWVPKHAVLLMRFSQAEAPRK